MALPTFLVIGAMKAGTSALHDWLGRHPDVFVPPRKELNYFAVPHMYPEGLAGYEAHFADGAGHLARGEASPSYAMRPMYDQVPERIAAVVPDVRIVYCVRHPVERIVSNYLHAYALGVESRPIDVLVREDERYVTVSSYATQLSAYTSLFPREAVLVVTAEEIAQGSCAQRLSAHLGIGAGLLPAPGRVHVTADKQRVRPIAYRLEKHPVVRRAVVRPGVRTVWGAATRTSLTSSQGRLSPDTRAWLEDRLRPEVEALLPWLPEDHDGWGLPELR